MRPRQEFVVGGWRPGERGLAGTFGTRLLQPMAEERPPRAIPSRAGHARPCRAVRRAPSAPVCRSAPRAQRGGRPRRSEDCGGSSHRSSSRPQESSIRAERLSGVHGRCSRPLMAADPTCCWRPWRRLPWASFVALRWPPIGRGYPGHHPVVSTGGEFAWPRGPRSPSGEHGHGWVHACRFCTPTAASRFPQVP